MSSTNIAVVIRESCNDDKNMQSFLIDLLDFTLTGRSWYKDKYNELIEKYALSEGDNK